jgi:hypothetical protein
MGGIFRPTSLPEQVDNMKGQRRHELEQNELADWMANLIEAVKPYSNLIFGGVLILVILGIGITFWAHRSRAQTARAWEDFQSALSKRDPAELDDVAKHYPGTDAAHWARVVLGDYRLREGCNELFKSRAGAKEELRKATNLYDSVLDETSNGRIRERATFGLARAWESQGDLKKALGLYKDLVRQWPEGPYAMIAQQRATALESPAIKQFYDKFAQFDPKPAFGDEPTQSLRLDDWKLPSPGESLLPKYDSFNPLGKPAKEPPSEPSETNLATPGADTSTPATDSKDEAKSSGTP